MIPLGALSETVSYCAAVGISNTVLITFFSALKFDYFNSNVGTRCTLVGRELVPGTTALGPSIRSRGCRRPKQTTGDYLSNARLSGFLSEFNALRTLVIPPQSHWATYFILCHPSLISLEKKQHLPKHIQ